MSGFTRKSIADYLDSYDDEIASLQESKREMMQDYRAQLAEKGFGKAAIKAEVDGLKIAMRRRRAIAKKGAEEVEQADAVADEIFLEITSASRATRHARENIEEFPKSKGEINGPEVEPTASSFDEIAETDSNSQPTSSPDANKTGAEPPPSAPVAPIEDDFEPPAFLARKKPMRPHCLNPECCAGQGYEHCHRCKKAMAESEAA